MRHLAILTLWALCLALFAIGVVVNVPWLLSENSRLEPWKIPIIWLSEITALILFIEYGIRCLIGSDPGQQRYGFTVKAFVVATVVDCGVSAISVAQENAAHPRAIQAEATVIRGYAWRQNTGQQRYTFDCLYRDHGGVQHIGWFSDVDDDVPNKVRTAIAQQNLPVDVMIAYDPAWPARCWLADVPYSHDNRLFIFSFLAILFTVLLTALLACFRDHAPWLPNPRVGPFLGTTWILCMSVFLQGGW